MNYVTPLWGGRQKFCMELELFCLTNGEWTGKSERISLLNLADFELTVRKLKQSKKVKGKYYH